MKNSIKYLAKKYIHIIRLLIFLFTVFSYVFFTNFFRDNKILLILSIIITQGIIYYIMRGKRKDE